MLNPPRQSKSKILADRIAEIIADRYAVKTRSQLAPNFDLAKIAGREVTVFTNTRVCEMMNRNTQKADYDVAVCVFQRIGPTDSDDILADDLLAFMENLGDQFLGEIVTLEDTSTIEVLGYAHEPLYDRATLESHRIFGAAITLQLTRQEDLPNR